MREPLKIDLHKRQIHMPHLGFTMRVLYGVADMARTVKNHPETPHSLHLLTGPPYPAHSPEADRRWSIIYKKAKVASIQLASIRKAENE